VAILAPVESLAVKLVVIAAPDGSTTGTLERVRLIKMTPFFTSATPEEIGTVSQIAGELIIVRSFVWV
jgi:hypothetical protein